MTCDYDYDHFCNGCDVSLLGVAVMVIVNSHRQIND